MIDENGKARATINKEFPKTYFVPLNNSLLFTDLLFHAPSEGLDLALS